VAHRLLLLRHAKSSWDDPSLPDRDRPLTKRGRRAAERVGAHLRATALPGLVLCSSSRRTRETLERLGLEGTETVVEDRLYGAAADDLLRRLRELPEDVGAVLVVGHNPGIQDLAVELAGTDAGPDGERLRSKFPTAALATFEVDAGWAELGPRRARLRSFVVPRELE
jgi:phosphohistidine phosphatase